MADSRATMAEADWPASSPVEKWDIGRLRPYIQNPKQHPREQIDTVKALIVEYGWVTPCVVDETGDLIAGHCRLIAAAELGIVRVPVIVVRGWTDAQKRAFRIAENASYEQGAWDTTLLRVELGDLGAMNFPLALTAFPETRLLEFGLAPDGSALPPHDPAPTLAEQFGVPPFSVLNARAGWWQVRKAAWIGLGMQPELGRGETLTFVGGGERTQ